MADNIPSPEDPQCCEHENGLKPAASESSLCIHTSSTASSQGHFMRWTDEKHSLYLGSLEASFVEQLQKSMNLLHQHASDKFPVNGCNSDKYKVLQHGCCKKLNFNNNISFPDSEVNSPNLLRNPWIRHFRTAGRARGAFTPVRSEQAVLNRDARPLSSDLYLSACSKQNSMFQDCSQPSVGSSSGNMFHREVSDQNFKDEDKETKPIDLRMLKRLKTDVSTDSSKDQIVPFLV